MSREHIKTLAKLIRSNCGRRRLDQVFADAVEMMALAISNAVDLLQREQREARYMQIMKDYDEQERKRFPEILARLVDALECGPDDVLGQVFGELEQGNSYRGQFFTPFEVCRLMARMIVEDGEDVRARIRERGFITVQEPAAGAGAQVIAMAEALQELGINYQQHMHVTAIDVDERAAHMAYVQFSLLHIPALVYGGNTISMQMREVWRTPAHVMGLWDYKLKRGYALGSEADKSAAASEVIPMPPMPAVQLELFRASA